MRAACRLVAIAALLVASVPALAISPAPLPAPAERSADLIPAALTPAPALSAPADFTDAPDIIPLQSPVPRTDVIAAVLTDPLILPMFAIGGMMLFATFIVRRRRRRRLAWGYVPPEQLPQRLFSWLR